jgi:hypothetical protein
MLLSHHQNVGKKSGHKNRKQIVWKCVIGKIFGDNSNQSKFDSREN